MTQATTKPPSPRRCQRILQAHRLRCQGLTLRQIAAELGCAHSTVSAYLRDFQLHRQYILETFAAEQLIDQVHQLVQPGQEPQQHQQHIAAVRELRLLLSSLSKIQAGQERQHQQTETETETDTAIALARSRNSSAGPDGHARLEDGRCAYNCPMCKPGIYEAWEARMANLPDNNPNDDDYLRGDYLDTPEQSQPDDDLSPQIIPESDQIRPNPTKPDHHEPEFPGPNDEFAPPPQNSRPQPKIGPQYPASWDNPLGYRPADAVVYSHERDARRLRRNIRSGFR